MRQQRQEERVNEITNNQNLRKGFFGFNRIECIFCVCFFFLGKRKTQKAKGKRDEGKAEARGKSRTPAVTSLFRSHFVCLCFLIILGAKGGTEAKERGGKTRETKAEGVRFLGKFHERNNLPYLQWNFPLQYFHIF